MILELEIYDVNYKIKKTSEKNNSPLERGGSAESGDGVF